MIEDQSRDVVSCTLQKAFLKLLQLEISVKDNEDTITYRFKAHERYKRYPISTTGRD